MKTSTNYSTNKLQVQKYVRLSHEFRAYIFVTFIGGIDPFCEPAAGDEIVYLWGKNAVFKYVYDNEFDFHFFGDKSFYVNTACLAAMLPTEFILQSGLRVPISRSYKKAAKESFLFGFGAILGKI